MEAQPIVRIIEVGPRDGLQNIAKAIPTAIKVELIERLRTTGLRSIEATSAVSPKAIPQLADNQTLLSNSSVQKLISEPSTRVPVLVPNVRGLELAIKHGVKEVAIFVSATEGFSKANTNCTVEEGLRRASEVAALAIKSGLQVRGCAFTLFAIVHIIS
jgi:hydroxymethylglutaryl-CoA lyase